MYNLKRNAGQIKINQPLGRQLWGQGISGVLLCAFFIGVPITTAAQTFEPNVTLKASQILPRELLSGANFRVEEKVGNDGYINIYKLHSNYGEFTVVSTAMLRKRIQEINAITAMEQVKKGKEFLSSFKEGGLKTLSGAKDLVTKPLRTTYGAIAGVGKVFKSASDSMFSFRRSKAESNRLKDVIGFSKVKREYAHQFDVDVYSRNEPLQDRLNKIAWAGYAGGLSVSAALMPVTGGLGMAISVSRLSRTFNEIFRATPPNVLRGENHKKLLAMGVNKDIADLFINNPAYTPREQTLLVAALEEMKGVLFRRAFVKFAVPTSDSDMAFFRQQQAEMYAGYHRTVARIERFVPLGRFVAGRRGRMLVFNVPMDHLVWTETIAGFVDAAEYRMKGQTWVREKQLWVTGTLSPLARREMIKRGWQIREQSEGQLLGTAKSYPKYEKTVKAPSATLDVQSTSVAVGIGVGWGDGKLRFKGKEYLFSVEGLSLADLGFSRVSATGEVYDLKRVSDFAGNYVASKATFAVHGGKGDVTLRNGKGVSITVRSEQKGTQLSLGVGGITVKLK